MSKFEAVNGYTVINHEDSTVTIYRKTMKKKTTIPAEYIVGYELHKRSVMFHDLLALDLDHPSFFKCKPTEWPSDLYHIAVKKKQFEQLRDELHSVLDRTRGVERRPYKIAPRADLIAKSVAKRDAKGKDVIEFGELLVTDEYVYHQGVREPVDGVTARIETEESLQGRMSAGRVVGGAILLGPVGALLGGMARKSDKRVYLSIQLPEGGELVAAGGPESEESARKIVGILGSPNDRVEQQEGGLDYLSRLADLHARGVLDDEEFSVAKRKHLGL
ncbi:hypothetical protein CCICO_04220 [Corynebacterium ciconiae DSM 44920]|uniref:SHOCT domain-containing protein n=1 Tax=Corynebacterium ciconiae TaxID=227319 RepID=UPI00036D5E0B|nr:SHOCT domain-containing protein [Corynebacterium ciconiae]WKD60881.1 hypothetical protein CCICO_04220 [Corynebacterium ciconiae DSM 44920]